MPTLPAAGQALWLAAAPDVDVKLRAIDERLRPCDIGVAVGRGARAVQP